MDDQSPTYACVRNAWQEHEGELRHFLAGRVSDPHLADDLLQEVFVKAMRHRETFCSLDSARAWLFRVARNVLVDHFRLKKEQVELPDDLAANDEEAAAVDGLAACIPRVLSELSDADREAIRLCDLEGMTQEAFARLKGLSLPAAKSRVQRARARMRKQLVKSCQVEFGEDGQVLHFVPRPPLGQA